HCTGRLITGGRGTRPESEFDPDAVFGACLDNDVAVEINSRPERRDPPTRLLEHALELGCLFSIDTDAHAPGQLEFLDHGCARTRSSGRVSTTPHPSRSTPARSVATRPPARPGTRSSWAASSRSAQTPPRPAAQTASATPARGRRRPACRGSGSSTNAHWTSC